MGPIWVGAIVTTDGTFVRQSDTDTDPPLHTLDLFAAAGPIHDDVTPVFGGRGSVCFFTPDFCARYILYILNRTSILEQDWRPVCHICYM